MQRGRNAVLQTQPCGAARARPTGTKPRKQEWRGLAGVSRGVDLAHRDETEEASKEWRGLAGVSRGVDLAVAWPCTRGAPASHATDATLVPTVNVGLSSEMGLWRHQSQRRRVRIGLEKVNQAVNTVLHLLHLTLLRPELDHALLERLLHAQLAHLSPDELGLEPLDLVFHAFQVELSLLLALVAPVNFGLGLGQLHASPPPDFLRFLHAGLPATNFFKLPVELMFDL
mmetsp:Transcript_7522/g.17200  ORF Transcript_7522/g.17200 Transcript_7522/m.17200 type:complete len:228 (-) Transcript_7522:1027-1710(-)